MRAGGCNPFSDSGEKGGDRMDSLFNLLYDAAKVFLTVFATAYANELAKKISSKRNKRTAPNAGKRKGGSKRKK